MPRFVFVARLAKVEILNGSEVNSRYFILFFLFFLFVYFWVERGGVLL